MSLLELVTETETPRPRVSETTSTNVIDGIENGFQPGERNVQMARLAGVFRKHGHDYSMINAMLKAVNNSTGMGLSNLELSNIARSISSYPVELENRIDEEGEWISFDEAANKYELLSQRTGYIDFGYENFTSAFGYMLPGEVLYVAARGGVGKTNVGMNLIQGVAKSTGKICPFFSLEMNCESIYYRAGVTEGNKTNGYMLPHDAREWVKLNRSNIIKQWKNVLIYDKDSLTTEQMEMAYHHFKEKHGNPPLMLIDYLGYMRDAKSGSQYEQVSRIARGIKGLAKRLCTRVMVICQTSRSGGDGTEEVQINHLRDSGAIEESADYLVGIWKSTNDEHRLHCRILKHRGDKANDKWDLIRDGLSFKEVEYAEDTTKDKSFF